MYVCIDIEITIDSFLNEAKCFANKAYDIPILTQKLLRFVLILVTKPVLFLNLRRFSLSLRVFLAFSYFFAQFEPRVLIKLFLYKKKRVSKKYHRKIGIN